MLSGVLEIYLHRGQLTEARELLSHLGSIEESIDVQDRSIHAAARSALLYAESSFDHALNAGLEAAEVASVVGAGNQAVKQGLVWAVEAALVLGKREQANELLTMVEQLPPGLRPPFLEAHTHRFRARMDSDEAGFKTAAGSFREYGFPFWLAVTQLEHGEWLVAQGRTEEAESHLTEAREIFERLEARPWLERLDAVAPEGCRGVRMTCPSCGADNRPDAKFCFECGWALARTCPNGHPVLSDARFCDECGAAVAGTAQAAAAPVTSAPAAERRLVSVLFADLVGFTAASEQRDAEDTRELLSRYFDTSRRLIELYGGTVEKFIGDAVMAVWGTPTATEDDAERAVRAALDLVAAVSALGDEVGAPELRARAGVLTGEAAVTIGAEGQGMVAGDLVNTASRVQSAAEPGMVFVGESTRRSTEQTIVYEDAGSFELKGKEGLTPLWRAQRVVSGLRGSLKSQGLEAPFVGRDRELRQIKDLFHASADERKAHLVSLTGIAGIGKSRLSWEFYKYFDGIADTVYWHRGRCLSYGEGVTYWALADMVRMRCRISEEEEPASALSKLHATLEEHFLDAEERSFLEPRLAHLLGLAEHQARDQQDLFAAWRLFFERLSESYPTVLAFEDMQWADASLLDFVEYLLDWSRSHPIFVVTLARPELMERRPTWGAGQRSFTSLYLEPLSQQAMEELLAGLVPGLPVEVRDRILARAEGIPLYAVETVRMLLDRGLLVQDGPAYGHGRGRSARGAGDAARPHRGAARRAVRGGAAAAPGRGGARQDVHARRVGSPLGLRRRPRAGARRPRAQGGARCAGRPALARARPVRLPPGPRSARRLRDALEAGAACQASRSRRAPERCVCRGRGRGRRGHRVALPCRLRGRARCGRRGRDQGQGAGHARARRRARRVARRRRRGEALLRAGGASSRTSRPSARRSSPARARWPREPAISSPRAGCSKSRSPSTRSSATRTPLRA